MNIAFLISSPELNGGSYVIFQHAAYAMKIGANVCMITKKPVSPMQLDWHPSARTLNWITMDEGEKIHFDVVIATWWATVFDIHRISSSKYVYFVQSIESRFYSESEKPLQLLAESTYSLPMQFVTEANWISNYLRTAHCKSVSVVLNGIRKDLYDATGSSHAERRKGYLRILVEGPVDVPFKNVPNTIKLCQRSEADEVWLLTSSSVSSYPGVSCVFSRLPISEVAPVYRSCDLIVKLSFVEGMFGPPLEMFHCGGTAITYNVSGSDEYLKHEYNALVASSGDENQVVSFIRRLKTDSVFLESLKLGALKTASEWPDWDASSRMFWNTIDSMEVSDTNVRLEIERFNILHRKFFECADYYRKIARDGKTINAMKSLLKNYFPILSRIPLSKKQFSFWQNH